MASSSPIRWLLLAPVAALAQAACFAPPGHQSGGRGGDEVRETGPAPADSADPIEDLPANAIYDEVEQVGGGGLHAGDGSVPALDDGPCGHPIDRLHAQAEGAAFLYAERPQGPRILSLCLTLDATALASLTVAPRDDVVATVQFGGRAWEVGLHLKGSANGSMRPISEKAAFKIDFHEWSSGARFYGVKRLTLNSMIQDPTMAAEHAAWRLYAAAGVPRRRAMATSTSGSTVSPMG